jgi:hypothetical protein
MFKNLQKISKVRLLNIILLIFLIVVSIYISFRISNYREGFDDAAPTKINGTTTILNGKNSIPSAANNTSNIKIVTASENKNNEINASVTSAPSVKISVPPKVSTTTGPSAAPAFAPAVAHRVPLEPSDLSPKEKQLFDAFLEKRITDEKIQELIQSGILTEQLVEKFLSMIDDLPEGPPVTRAPKKLSSITSATQDDSNLLEPFCGNNYAKANGF